MSRFCVSLFILTLLLCTVQSQPWLTAQTPAYFSFREENRDYLNYYKLISTSSSIIVHYTFGEVALSADGNKSRIFLATAVALNEEIQTSNIRGENIELRTAARTEDFTLMDGGILTWFGCIQLSDILYDKRPKEEDDLNNSEQVWLQPEQTEFVTELVRASDNVRLAILDSTGIIPATSPLNAYYGTSPQRVTISYVIPSVFNGVKAFIRISPRYYGPSSSDMALQKLSNWVNYSALYDSVKAMFTWAVEDSLRNRAYYDDFFRYCDSARAKTGTLPSFFGIQFNDSISTLFYTRYMVQRTHPGTGASYWIDKRIPQPKNGNLLMETPVYTDELSIHTQSTRMPRYPELLFALPNSGNPSQITARICSYTDCHVAIRVISVGGEPLGTIRRGNVIRGINDWIIDTDLEPGMYILSLEEDNGRQFHQIKVAIQ